MTEARTDIAGSAGEAAEGAAKRVRPSWPKRKVALMLGYCGTGYQGMQLNPNAKTIEKELFDALVKEQLITADNAADPHKVSWMRACRTDKGVHACGQVVSLKMLLRNDYPDLPKDDSSVDERTVAESITRALNEHLPGQIRIFGVKRTTGSFHAKERTDSRIYEYMLPTYVFKAIDPTPYKSAETETRTAEVVDFEQNEGPPKKKSPVDDEDDGLEEEAEEEEAPEARTGNKVMESEISEDERKEILAYRIDPATLLSVREMFKTYIGYHSYHNFTTGVSPTEGKARRYIIDVSVEEPFLQDGMEWTRIMFHGQSFMLHQIRKMVGLAVMAVRLSIGPSIIPKCFLPARVNIPRAPALGLLLDRAILQQYNERNHAHDAIDFLEYEEERRRLKEERIYPGIYGEERRQAQFWGWLKCNDDHAHEFSFLTSK